MSTLQSCFILLFSACVVPFAQEADKISPRDRGSSNSETLSATSVPILADSSLHRFKQGFDFSVWLSNFGVMGRQAWFGSPPDGVGSEYPPGSAVEHLYSAGLWIGARVDTSTSGVPSRAVFVSTATSGTSQTAFEFGPAQNGTDSFFTTNRFLRDGRNRKWFDDDGDGSVDEDELDGVDNDADGAVDEDFGAISERDVYVAYFDTNAGIPGHTPLGIKVWQKSFAWSPGRFPYQILPLEFNIINIGSKVLDSILVGFYVDPDIGPVSVEGYARRNDGFASGGWIRCSNPSDLPKAEIGAGWLTSAGPDNRARTWSFDVAQSACWPASTEWSKYGLMWDCMMTGEYFPPLRDRKFMLVIHDDTRLRPGDSLKVHFAIVNGDSIGPTSPSVLDNALQAQLFHDRGYSIPLAPPAPPLKLRREGNTVRVDWSPESANGPSDPLQEWDELDVNLSALPDTHWRRRNPPPGAIHGGRNFEGFRVYRCEGPKFDSSRMTLLADYDVADDLSVGYQSGLRFSYIDSGLSPRKNYWYSVTSYSLPVSANDEAESPLLANLVGTTITPEYRLPEPYPNPFNPSTSITFELPEWATIRLRIFDLLGREVAVLAEGAFPPGAYQRDWDASGFPAGVYFCRLESPSFSSTTKLILLR